MDDYYSDANMKLRILVLSMRSTAEAWSDTKIDPRDKDYYRGKDESTKSCGDIINSLLDTMGHPRLKEILE